MSDLFADLAVRYLHFLAIFAMFALLSIEHVSLKGRVDSDGLKRMAIVDAAFGISALIALFAGIGMWFLVGKPAGFYNNNWIFHTKVTLFVLVGILSFIPTRFIAKQRKKTALDGILVPRSIVHIIRLELFLLCLIPLLAVLMANGVGYTY